MYWMNCTKNGLKFRDLFQEVGRKKKHGILYFDFHRNPQCLIIRNENNGLLEMF